MNVIQTEFDFILPKGYVDENGNLHQEGKMRLSTAADEILPMKDPRVQQNGAYLTVILLSRVISRLGNLPMISTGVIEGLFSADFAYLQDFYNKINEDGKAGTQTKCPKCGHGFEVDLHSSGE